MRSKRDTELLAKVVLSNLADGVCVVRSGEFSSARRLERRNLVTRQGAAVIPTPRGFRALDFILGVYTAVL